MSVHPLRAIGRGLRTAVAVIIEVFHEFVRDECVPLAGSLAFFTLFSFGPILALVVDIASVAVEPGIIRAELVSSIGAMFGTPVAEQTRVALEQLRERQLDHPVARVAGVALLLFAATMVLAQAQQALNRVWAVERRAGFRGFVFKRLVSLGLIFGLVVLLFTSMTTSAVVGSLGPRLDLVLPEGVRALVIGAGNAGISFALLALVAALMHGILPEARIPWSDAAIGGLVTAFLLAAGHAIIGWILSATPMASIFGASQSLALLLFWVFYSSAIVLWGAEFTKVVARRRGHEVAPSEGATRTRRTLV
ncbi:MAG: YihY/virulence factor BrkB family protein, partial [Myxococcota bacterium]